MKSFFGSLLLLLTYILAPVVSAASDFVPIPPVRPDILQVSPAYIEQLREKSKRNTSPKVIRMDDGDHSSSDYSVELNQESDGLPELADLTKSDILDILDNKSITPQQPKAGSTSNTGNLNQVINHPIPSHKPFNENVDVSEERETTLISFSLKDDQLHLDDHLKTFLRNHAVRLFNDDRDLRMDIQAYAKGVDGQKHSDIRLSLARALEVRSYLINQKISPSRLKLSPIGQDKGGENHDRIDLVFIK